MTPEKILELVNAMTPPELTAMVAEKKGWVWCEEHRYWMTPDNRVIYEECYSPPTRIDDAIKLLPELSKVFAVDIGPENRDYSLELLRNDGKPCLEGCDCLPFFFKAWDELALAITRAYCWWQMCEKEEC